MSQRPFCTALDDYLSYLGIIKGRSPCTLREYKTDVLMFLEWHINTNHNKEGVDGQSAYVNREYLQRIAFDDMCACIMYCQKTLNSAPGTRARKIVSIRQFWKYLLHNQLIVINPADRLETPKLPKRLPRYLSLEESVRLLLASKSSPRDHCIITLFLNCALRISELGALKIGQVAFDNLRVVGKGNKERRIFHTPAAKTAVANWLVDREKQQVNCDALFISNRKSQLSIYGIQNVVKKYATLAGFDASRVSAHTLRHTSATLMYRYGKVDVRLLQQILGHESVATTEIYTHVDESQLFAAVNTNPLAIMFS